MKGWRGTTTLLPALARRFADRVVTVSSDASSLLRALALASSKKPSALTSASAARGVLIDEARRRPGGNSVAASLLRIDRHVGLIRYHGALGYLRGHVLPSSLLPSTGGVGGGGTTPNGGIDGADSSPSSTSTSSGVGMGAADGEQPGRRRARVAFMITAAQRERLAELGYDQSHVRRLTPLEALLIVEHRIEAAAKGDDGSHGEGEGADALLRRLVEENERLARSEAEEVAREAAAAAASRRSEAEARAQEEEGTPAAAVAEVEAGASKSSSAPSGAAQTPPSLSGVGSTTVGGGDAAREAGAYHDPPANPAEGDDNDDGWFEVVECTAAPSADDAADADAAAVAEADVVNVVGLYRDRDEAVECARTRGEFAERRRRGDGAAAPTYEVRRRRGT